MRKRRIGTCILILVLGRSLQYAVMLSGKERNVGSAQGACGQPLQVSL